MPGRNNGKLTRHQRDSNGGVHRGPDLKPRDFVRAVLLKATRLEETTSGCGLVTGGDDALVSRAC